MKELAASGAIRRECLSEKNYLEDLIREAAQGGQWSAAENERLQEGLMKLLAEQATAMTKGESSSLPVETLQQLAGSIQYTLGVCLKARPTPAEALRKLKSTSAAELFEEGQRQIQQKIMKTRHHHRVLTENLFETPNVYYRSTIRDGIRGFFKLYQPAFAAQELHITVDYPTYLPRPEQAGIEFIEEYLRRIDAENAFCTLFDPKRVDRLLCGISPDYRSCPMNLFEPVFLTALSLVCLGRSPQKLDLQPTERQQLEKEWGGLSAEALQEQLAMALERLKRYEPIPEHTIRYAVRCLPLAARSLARAAAEHTLTALIPVQANEFNEQNVLSWQEETMPDTTYRALLEQLNRMKTREERVGRILEAVHSLQDLMDLAADAELTVEELTAIFRELPMAALAVLTAEYPDRDMLSRDSDQRMYEALRRRRAELTDEERKEMEECGSIGGV